MKYEYLPEQDQILWSYINEEKNRQEDEIELIASENYASEAVLEAMSTVLANKYSEGYSGHRYYGGNQVIDKVETLAIERAKELFGAEHANVQPLSGSPANAAVYMAFLEPGDKVLGLRLDHGGHLSHGHSVNFSGRLYNFVQYGVNPDTGIIDMEEVRRVALAEKPKMIVAGFSAYSREIDWKKFKEIADEVGAYTFADIAHIAGLIAAKIVSSPVPYFDVVSTTTHKTLRGPRGALILCKEKYAKAIDRAVFPGMQGGPHDHITAAKAVAFGEALKPEFVEYSKQVVLNAKALAQALTDKGYRIISGGTDNHLMVVDLNSKGLAGKDAEVALESIGISVSRSTIPNDPNPPLNPSGVRLGTPAVTTRGMMETDMATIADLIDSALENRKDETKLLELKAKTKELCRRFPIYNK
jgi:glycine hydroxymethyltransferase